ncbi:preprotein translocase subunit SecY [Anaerotignum sp. MSJ-24]|uniref:preprotein translocase subunit SecY n=1 Tax=Anaerotignum sp. MSJ-24 TaxID=2841521 RepID=UPI001C0FA5FD|nr:preprotein translocase subunit SecY [Anaerotignum sp. MSJ-24]MBU5465182.1 preprotein translocase subunit SecY [Anaerotignum sp. MSJ-24]
MFKILVNSWKVKEIRDKMLYTLLILAIVRLGAHIYLPGISAATIKAYTDLNSTGTLYNIIAGGAGSNYSIFALGIGPYITSSIIMQLLCVAIPTLEQLSKEGEDGRQKINKYTRYITVVLAALQGTGIALNYKTMMTNPSTLKVVIAIITLIAGSMFIMWLAEQITQKGISNGSSMIIFVNIISSLPNAITALVGYCKEGKTGILKTVGILVLLFIVIVLIVKVNDGERRLPVQYANKMTGRRMGSGGNSSVFPIKVNTAGVISIIFAISLIQFPETISGFISSVPGWLEKVIGILSMTHPVGAIIYVILIFAFSFFYTSIVINPNEIAENMKKNGGFIPGIRPGMPTANYITRVVNRITWVGAVCFAGLALVPIVMQWIFKMNVGFGGTTLIIVVGVCLDIVKALESQLLMRHYKGFLD